MSIYRAELFNGETVASYKDFSNEQEAQMYCDYMDESANITYNFRIREATQDEIKSSMSEVQAILDTVLSAHEKIESDIINYKRQMTSQQNSDLTKYNYQISEFRQTLRMYQSELLGENGDEVIKIIKVSHLGDTVEFTSQKEADSYMAKWNEGRTGTYAEIKFWVREATQEEIQKGIEELQHEIAEAQEGSIRSRTDWYKGKVARLDKYLAVLMTPIEKTDEDYPTEDEMARLYNALKPNDFGMVKALTLFREKFVIESVNHPPTAPDYTIRIRGDITMDEVSLLTKFFNGEL